MEPDDFIQSFANHALAPLGIPLSKVNRVILEEIHLHRGLKCHVKFGRSEPISHFSSWDETLASRDAVRMMHANLVAGVQSKLIDQGHVYPFLLAGCV